MCNLLDSLLTPINSPPPTSSITVVKITSSNYSSNNGITQKRVITVIKRKSYGYDVINDGINDIGADEVINSISNLNECEDGIYNVITVESSIDWESGEMEYGLKLTPYHH